MSSLIIHVPHASTRIPDEVIDQFILDPGAQNKEAQESADLYTDQLAHEAWPAATIIKADVSRVVIDVERYSDDALETMSSVGRGMIYSTTHDAKPLRRKISKNERIELQSKYYDSHWARLRKLSKGNTLIDLHSYPVKPWAIESNPHALRPEIDLGTSQGLTPRAWVAAVRKHFELEGYQVGENTPYTGVVNTGAAQAIMIEIRRDMIGLPGASGSWQRLIKTLSSIPI